MKFSALFSLFVWMVSLPVLAAQPDENPCYLLNESIEEVGIEKHDQCYRAADLELPLFYETSIYPNDSADSSVDDKAKQFGEQNILFLCGQFVQANDLDLEGCKAISTFITEKTDTEIHVISIVEYDGLQVYQEPTLEDKTLESIEGLVEKGEETRKKVWGGMKKLWKNMISPEAQQEFEPIKEVPTI